MLIFFAIDMNSLEIFATCMCSLDCEYICPSIMLARKLKTFRTFLVWEVNGCYLTRRDACPSSRGQSREPTGS